MSSYSSQSESESEWRWYNHSFDFKLNDLIRFVNKHGIKSNDFKITVHSEDSTATYILWYRAPEIYHSLLFEEESSIEKTDKKKKAKRKKNKGKSKKYYKKNKIKKKN